jgi:hypothetical protein
MGPCFKFTSANYFSQKNKQQALCINSILFVWALPYFHFIAVASGSQLPAKNGAQTKPLLSQAFCSGM